MRLLTVTAAMSLAMAGPGCTLVGAGTGAVAAGIANHFIDPASPHRSPVGATAAAGAVMGLIIDLLVLNAVNGALAPLKGESCASCR